MGDRAKNAEIPGPVAPPQRPSARALRLSAGLDEYVVVAWHDVRPPEQSLATSASDARWVFEAWARLERGARFERAEMVRLAEGTYDDLSRLRDRALDELILEALATSRLVFLCLPRDRLPLAPPPPRPKAVPLSPPKSGPTSQPLFEYEVIIVDDTGAAVQGARLKLELDGTPRMTTTNDQGVGRASWVDSTTGKVRLLNLESLKTQLGPRWQEKPASRSVPQDNAQPVGEEAKEFRVQCGQATTIVLLRPRYPLRLRWLDLVAKPVSDSALAVAETQLTTDGDGYVDAMVDEQAASVPLEISDLEGPVDMALGALGEVGDDGDSGWKARLYNLGFLWDPAADDDDDETVIALQDFQAQYQLPVTGKLDDATRGQIAQVYGS
jgi:hypothetical protein